MEAEIGGQFLVPIRAAAARAVLKVVSEDRVTCPPCVVGRKSTAGVRIVNRGALDATISVSCMTFADKVVVLAPSAEGLVPRLSDSRSSHEDGRKALGEEGFSESQENKAVDTSAEAFGSLMEHILVPGYGSALVPLQFEAHECGTHRGRVTFNSAGEHVGVVELVGEGQEPPLSIDPALSVGVVSTNAPRSIGVILRNRSQTCLHVHAVQPGRTPLAEVVISPATVAVHHGSFRVNVRVTALPAPSDIAGGAFSMPLRFFYDLDGARYHVETILEGTATRLTLLTPKVIRVPECTVWDKPVTVHLPIENKGAVPQRVHCQVSHVPTLRFGSAEEALDLGILGSSNGKTKSSSAHFVGKKSHSKLVKSTESLRTVEVLVPAGSTLPVPILFDPSNWKERTALFVTVRSDGAPAHHEHRISIEAEPKRPVLRVQESLVQAGAVARGSSGFATATLVRHRTVGEERHDVLDALRYSVGKNLGKGVRIEALDQHAEGDFPVGSLELQLRVFVTETAPSGSPCIVQVPVSFTRAGRPAGNVQIAVQVRPVAADISTANLALSAGPVPRGITSIVNIPIMNTSQTAVAVQVRRLEQKGEASFEVDPKTFEIAAGDTFSVPVRFTPETAEACSSSWEISTSTTQLPVTITGVGMIPLISWSADDETEPALLSFPDLLLGDLGTRNLLVRNKGVESVEVTVVVTDTSGTFALRKPLGSSTNVNVLPSPSTTTDPAESLGPETSQTLKILPNTTQTVQLVFCPTRESDHFSSTVEFSTIGLLPMTSRVVGRCWDTTTAVTGYDVQPPEMCDGPWDIPPAVFIEEDPEEEDETDEEDSVRESSLEDSDDDLYARVGPTIPHPTPSDSTEAPRPSLMQELDALRPVELECTQYGTLALKWQHAPGGGYVLGSRHLTLANLRPPVPRVEGVAPTGGGTGKQAAAAGGAHPKQPSAGASTSKRAAASKQPPAVPADFVIDSYEHSIAYYPALGIYHDAPAPQTFDSHLSIVLDASEGTVEPGGERRVRISVARPTAAASVPATTPSGASRASHPAAAATGARTDDDGKRLNSPPRKREISGGASIAVPPAAVGVATTSPDPAVEEPVRLEACYKITLNGGLKLGAVPMPATDNRVWIIRIVLDGVE
ncbi:hypothetical protein HKX48_009305 [Thoreauomyces humboldtii]|nr:hypothetical protein HKX48_009305 [Thoreauomyces humboldtii]